jgi:hypothetical protein
MPNISAISAGSIRRFAAAVADDAMRVESFLQRGIGDSLEGAATRMAKRVADSPELVRIRATDRFVADSLTFNARDGMQRLVRQLAASDGVVTPEIQRIGMAHVDSARRAAMETSALVTRLA